MGLKTIYRRIMLYQLRKIRHEIYAWHINKRHEKRLIIEHKNKFLHSPELSRFSEERKNDVLRVFSILQRKGLLLYPEMCAKTRKLYYHRKLNVEQCGGGGGLFCRLR